MFKQARVLPPFLTVLMLSACSGEPEWMEVYEQCKETVQAQSDEIAGSASDSEDPQARAMAESMGKMAINMAMTACEMIRTSCEQDEDSPTCRAYIEQGKQR